MGSKLPPNTLRPLLLARPVFGEYLGASHVRRPVGKRVILRFFVDKNLAVERNLGEIIEQPDGYDVLVVFFQTVKQMSPATTAEATLCPVR